MHKTAGEVASQNCWESKVTKQSFYQLMGLAQVTELHFNRWEKKLIAKPTDGIGSSDRTAWEKTKLQNHRQKQSKSHPVVFR